MNKKSKVLRIQMIIKLQGLDIITSQRIASARALTTRMTKGHRHKKCSSKRTNKYERKKSQKNKTKNISKLEQIAISYLENFCFSTSKRNIADVSKIFQLHLSKSQFTIRLFVSDYVKELTSTCSSAKLQVHKSQQIGQIRLKQNQIPSVTMEQK